MLPSGFKDSKRKESCKQAPDPTMHLGVLRVSIGGDNWSMSDFGLLPQPGKQNFFFKKSLKSHLNGYRAVINQQLIIYSTITSHNELETGIFSIV